MLFGINSTCRAIEVALSFTTHSINPEYHNYVVLLILIQKCIINAVSGREGGREPAGFSPLWEGMNHNAEGGCMHDSQARLNSPWHYLTMELSPKIKGIPLIGMSQ